MLSVTLFGCVVKPQNPEDELKKYSSGVCTGNKITMCLNIDWECGYQRHSWLFFHVTSHSFLLEMGRQCYLNHLLEKDVLEFSRTTVSIMWSTQQLTALVCPSGSKCRRAKCLTKDQLAARAPALTTPPGKQNHSWITWDCLKAFSQGASQSKWHFLFCKSSAAICSGKCWLHD